MKKTNINTKASRESINLKMGYLKNELQKHIYLYQYLYLYLYLSIYLSIYTSVFKPIRIYTISYTLIVVDISFFH